MTKISQTHHITKTGVKKRNPVKNNQLYLNAWAMTNGIFFRGSNGSRGTGLAVLGNGTYFSWSKGMAGAFARMSVQEFGGEPIVEKFHLPKNLKMLDFQGNECWAIRKGLGVHSSWDKIGDTMFVSIFTAEVKAKGYDGVISDDKADGLVVFDADLKNWKVK